MKTLTTKHNNSALIEDIANLLAWFIPSSELDRFNMNETDLVDLIADQTHNKGKAAALVNDLQNLLITYETGEKFQTTIDL